MELQEILNICCTVGPETVSDFGSHCEQVCFDKGQPLVSQGESSDHLYLVKTGVFRMSYETDGVEDTLCFGHDGDAFMSFHCFYSGEPSQFSCIAVTAIEAYRINFSDLRTLMDSHPDLLVWFNAMLVEELYLLERRYVYFGAKDAYSRFKTFVAARPDILSHVPAKYIAQYLKVRPETFYRLRARFLRTGSDTD